MREKIISILSELRPEFDFSEPVNFIEEGMLDSFDIVTLVDTLDTEYDIVIDGIDIIPENLASYSSVDYQIHDITELFVNQFGIGHIFQIFMLIVWQCGGHNRSIQ